MNSDRAQVAALGARPPHRRDTHCGTCDGSGWIETTAGDVACLVCHYPPTCPGCVAEAESSRDVATRRRE